MLIPSALWGGQRRIQSRKDPIAFPLRKPEWSPKFQGEPPDYHAQRPYIPYQWGPAPGYVPMAMPPEPDLTGLREEETWAIIAEHKRDILIRQAIDRYFSRKGLPFPNDDYEALSEALDFAERTLRDIHNSPPSLKTLTQFIDDAVKTEAQRIQQQEILDTISQIAKQEGWQEPLLEAVTRRTLEKAPLDLTHQLQLLGRYLSTSERQAIIAQTAQQAFNAESRKP